MDMQSAEPRSPEPILNEDLSLFATASFAKLTDVFNRTAVASLYRDRLLLLVLAQGGALHFANGVNGLKDIDIWAFFANGPDRPFPHRARWTTDFGPSKFGKSPDEAGFTGRRIDILGRSIDVGINEPPEESVKRWLSGWSKSAIALRKKPMFIIAPPEKLGLRIN
ncbi:hypothetical protein [Rhizobium leucaenae]|uniref:Uncharacterized protein n=1 Tax=Rhizobium leucaenae TaxID=29450 RepID=A0A7W7EIG0_9HYPH|nr:hypothetical protein [Rhizobium leucaenae]MBB4566354.1 hypothetical protein [Rhizobium leucaenae]MBB6304489.1 hypothetical protein [Rhizobium leucaenae]